MSLPFSAISFASESGSLKPHLKEFIRRDGDQLFEGDKPFRFFGLAAPNLQAHESQYRPDFANRFPDEYEIRDLLGALRELGARATRTFSLSVHHPDDKGAPVYIQGHRDYNEEAFRCLDRVLALAHEYDVRIIIPVIASQSFPSIRGVDEFAALAGKEGGLFWTDEGLKDDFRHLMSTMLNRRNTYTGLLYRDDPAILAWQLGNEFGSYAGDRGLPYEDWAGPILTWSLEMAPFIKSIAPNHLVMEAGGGDTAAFIADPHIDIISSHLYEYWARTKGEPWQLAPLARAHAAETRGKKPLMVDEFGLGSFDNVVELMDAIIEEGIVGGLMWSIRSHRRDGGWYYHNEGGTPTNSFHFPGFANGFAYESARFLGALRERAFAIRGMETPPFNLPTPKPVLMPLKDGFTWRGSMGAAYYVIERATAPSGPWQTVATGLHDSVIADPAAFEHTEAALLPLVLWHDTAARPGQTFHYRIKGCNVSGCSDWSEPVQHSHSPVTNQ